MPCLVRVALSVYKPTAMNSESPYLLVSVLAAALMCGGCGAREEPQRAQDHVHKHAALAPADLAIDSAAAVNPWTHLNLNNNPDNFQFAIVTDRTGGHRAGVFEDAINKLNLLQPEFVMSVGDLIEGYTQDRAQIAQQWDEFRSFTAKLKMPFFYVVGNHDISNKVQEEEWQKRFGRTYYHFVYRDVLFLCLNSEDPPDTHMSDEQAEYVRKALAENPNVRWTLVFFHQPLWLHEDQATKQSAKGKAPTGWLKIEEALGKRPYTVFAGHVHGYTKYERNDRRYIVLGTTGGASELRGIPFGEFDHFAWITMTGDGPIVANLMLSGIWDENVTTEKSRDLVNSMVSAARVVVQPLRTATETFEGGEAEMKLINDANYPLSVAARFRPSDQLRPDPYAVDDTIDPNSVRVVKLKLQTRRAVKVEELNPLLLDLELSYKVPKGPAIQMQRLQAVAVDRVLPIPKRAAPVVVDGKLDEWKSLPIACVRPAQIREDRSAWKGPADGSFKIAVEHDEKFVYVAVQVTDERIVTHENKPPWEQDGVEIRLDARPDPARSQGTGEGEFDEFIFVAMPPAESPQKTSIFQKHRLTPGVQAACVRASGQRDGAYAAEIAIPVEYLNERQKGPWKQLRVNVALNDVDDASGTNSQLWWRPDWREKQTYPGSGTFSRD
jgi:hypothetical protein